MKLKPFTSDIEEFKFMWGDEELARDILRGQGEMERLVKDGECSLGPIRLDTKRQILFLNDKTERIIPVAIYDDNPDRTIFDFAIDDDQHYLLIRADYLPDDDAEKAAKWYLDDHTHGEATIKLLSANCLSDGSTVALLKYDIK